MDLKSAIETNNLVRVKELIKNGINVNEGSVYLAAHNARSDILKELIKAGGNVNIQVLWGTTPLHAALYGFTDCEIDEHPFCKMLYFEIIQSLLKAGADVNAEDIYEESGLMLIEGLDSYHKKKLYTIIISLNAIKKRQQERMMAGKIAKQKRLPGSIDFKIGEYLFGKTKLLCKKYKIRLTVTRNGKRVYKTKKVLEDQIKRKMK
jgi:hypothetical protein